MEDYMSALISYLERIIRKEREHAKRVREANQQLKDLAMTKKEVGESLSYQVQALNELRANNLSTP